MNWEQEAEGAPFPDSPDPGNEGKAAGKVGGKKGESRKRALSEGRSLTTDTMIQPDGPCSRGLCLTDSFLRIDHRSCCQEEEVGSDRHRL